MEIAGKISLIVHILAGLTTLLAGPLAIFYRFNDTQKHRRAGKIFFYAMAIVCLTAIGGYLKYPGQPFFQFLLGVAAIVFGGVMRGVRAMQIMQGSTVRPLDFVYTALVGVFGVWMVAMAIWHFSNGSPSFFPVLFAIFGLMGLSGARLNYRYFSRPAVVHPLDWYQLHVGSMLGAFTASTTAFTVNSAHFLPWYLQWFGPALVLLPLQIYFARQIKGQKQRAHNRPAASAV